VVLGSPTIKAREDASAALLNYGFTFFETLKVSDGGKTLLTPHVYKAEGESVPVGVSTDVFVTVPRGEGEKLTKEARVDRTLTAPIAKGATVGYYEVRAGDTSVARLPLVALAAAPEGGLWRRYSDSVRLWFK
jgi:D-alanyl-D-alanine carboxypeptidase (penicillin-binding protein 5/6)